MGWDVHYTPSDFPLKSGNAEVISKQTSNFFVLLFPPPHQITHATCIYQTGQIKELIQCCWSGYLNRVSNNVQLITSKGP